MHDARLNGLAGVPREGCVAARAPHLITPIYFADHFPTTGTGFRILANECGGGQGVCRARMGNITVQALDLKAFGTGPGITDAALPGTGQKSVALGGCAAPNELGGHRGLGLTLGILIASLAHIANAAEEQIALLLNGQELLVHLRLYFPVGLH